MNGYDEYPTQDVDWGPDMWHAHYAWASQDCDGKSSGSGLYRQGDTVEWADDLDLLDRLVVWAYKLPDVDQSALTIRRNDKGGYEIDSSRDTEEGAESLFVYMCQDDCDLEEETIRRDHTAESMGY